MSVVKRAMLLLLLAAIGINAAPEDCDGLNKTLPTADLHKVVGDWVLVWSVSDAQKSYELLANLSSSHTKLRLLPDNKTIEFTEKNLFQDQSCTRYVLNLSTPSDPSDDHTLSFSSGTYEKDGHVDQFNDSGKVYFLETCADCLVMIYRGREDQYLLIYKREGHHQDVEQLKAAHSDHHKLAECLGFPVDKTFNYDGAADFCPEKSAPTETPAPMETPAPSGTPAPTETPEPAVIAD